MPTKLSSIAAALMIGLGCLGSSSSASAGDYAKTRYPVVLVHGFAGFESIGPVQYFWGIAADLQQNGAKVYAPAVSAANSTEVRGEQLLAELQRLQAVYGHKKFNLIGHSHGGLTARYVAGVAPHLVASVSTIGSPHHGWGQADAFLSLSGPAPWIPVFLDGLFSFMRSVSGQSAQPQSSVAAWQSMSTPGTRNFNSRFPAGAPNAWCGQGQSLVNGIRYYSITGVGTLTNVLDVDSLLGPASLYYGLQPNDGLIEKCSTHWGEVIRDDYPWNHIDEINHTFGLRGLFTPDPVAFYRSQVNRLKNLGL